MMQEGRGDVGGHVALDGARGDGGLGLAKGHEDDAPRLHTPVWLFECYKWLFECYEAMRMMCRACTPAWWFRCYSGG